MEDCNICFQSRKKFLTASVCGHKICLECFKSLVKNICPFCRQSYTLSELVLKKKQRINSNYNPPQNNYRISLLQNTEAYNQIPYIRVRRNMIRRRRRNLTFNEVIERRKIIKQRMRRKWCRKNGRDRKFGLDI